MPMPTFPQIAPPLTREGSINGIISSIAAEELSLSHILNTQGEKLQYVLGTLPGLEKAADLEEVMKVNKSVQDTMSDVMEQQMLLTAKLSAILRVANSMDRSHNQKFKNVKVTLKERELIVVVDTVEDITLEQGLFSHKAEFFETIFSIRPVIRQKRQV